MKLKLAGLIFLVITNLLNAEEIEVQIKLNKEKVMVGEVFEYQVQVKGKFKVSPNLIIPELENFEILSQLQVYNYKIQKGKAKSTLCYKFNITALKEGEFEIKGFKLKFKNKEYEIKPVKIVVEGIKEIPWKEEPKKFEFDEKRRIWI